MLKEIKNKKCKICESEFKPFRTTQTVCSNKCANELKEVKESKKTEQKKQKKTTERKTKLELAKITFNAYIKERDKREKCICCGRSLGSNFEAGHYFSGGGHSNVLFNENNVHAQRFECNNDKAGNFINYGVNLELRIGKVEFEILRAEAYDPKRWEIEELDQIIKKYKQKLKELRNENN
jgi:hypothetical protein